MEILCKRKPLLMMLTRQKQGSFRRASQTFALLKIILKVAPARECIASSSSIRIIWISVDCVVKLIVTHSSVLVFVYFFVFLALHFELFLRAVVCRRSDESRAPVPQLFFSSLSVSPFDQLLFTLCLSIFNHAQFDNCSNGKFFSVWFYSGFFVHQTRARAEINRRQLDTRAQHLCKSD